MKIFPVRNPEKTKFGGPTKEKTDFLFNLSSIRDVYDYNQSHPDGIHGDYFIVEEIILMDPIELQELLEDLRKENEIWKGKGGWVEIDGKRYHRCILVGDFFDLEKKENAERIINTMYLVNPEGTSYARWVAMPGFDSDIYRLEEFAKQVIKGRG